MRCEITFFFFLICFYNVMFPSVDLNEIKATMNKNTALLNIRIPHVLRKNEYPTQLVVGKNQNAYTKK